MTEKITLPWADKIRERLEERTIHIKFKNFPVIKEFITPILEYAEAEEKRINEEFEKQKNEQKENYKHYLNSKIEK